MTSNLQSIQNIEKAKNTRVRVLTSQNTLLYLKLDKLGLDENENLYVLHGDDKTDIVKFAGIYLKGRDKQEKRLFLGDIVKFDCENFYGKIVSVEGVLLGKEYSHNTHRYHYIILDNRSNNLPPNPDLIDKKSIEVIGNIYENPEYKIGGCEAKYYVYDIK